MRIRLGVLTLSALLLVGACTDAPTTPTESSGTALDGPSFMRGGSCELPVPEEEIDAYIDALTARVDALEAAGSLTAGQARALRNHLENARRQLDRGLTCAPLAQLQSFALQVEGLERAGALTGPEADSLLGPVGEVLDPPPILNASFEIDGEVPSVFVGSITGWSYQGDLDETFDVAQFGGDVGSATDFEEFHVTDGAYGARIFSKTGADTRGNPVPRTFTAGEHAGLSQVVDLTGVDAVVFDAELREFWDGTIFEARVLIDGAVAWSRNSVALYPDQRIDVSGLSGPHTLEVRVEAVATGTVSGLLTSRWFLFDHFRVEPAP